MFTGEFKFNLNDALGLNELLSFPEYDNAYHTTNEPIADWLYLTPVKNPRVLTVAASGDQPLLYAAAGASHVDTFDITVNACAIMDFKTTALQMLDYKGYVDTIQSLRNFVVFTPNKHIGDIIDHMPQRTRELMRAIPKYRPGAFQRDAVCVTLFPNDETTYAKMQQTVKSPFNFIWANLVNVPHYIEEKYDIINTSNVFEHYLGQGRLPIDIRETVEAMWPYLNVGGYILCTACFSEMKDIFNRFNDKWHEMGANISFPPSCDPLWTPIVIQKTR